MNNEHDANLALLQSSEAAARVLSNLRAGRPLNPAGHADGPDQQLSRARMILRTLGTRAAAGYMRKHGFSLQAALWWLLGTSERPCSTV